MNTLRVLLVDDESLARRGLKIRLQKFSDVDIIGECQNGKEALKKINDCEPDVVFLDIQMPGIDGFQVVQHLQSDIMPLIIFVTAYDHYALEAFKIHAVDYVMKPAEEGRLREAVDRAHERKQHQSQEREKDKLVQMIVKLSGESSAVVEDMLKTDEGNISSKSSKGYADKISIKDRGKIRVLRVSEIQWVDAAGDYMCLHTGEETHILRTTMKDLVERLNPEIFQRIHRSTLVNIHFIQGANTEENGESYLQLEAGTRLKVSRAHKNILKIL